MAQASPDAASAGATGREDQGHPSEGPGPGSTLRFSWPGGGNCERIVRRGAGRISEEAPKHGSGAINLSEDQARLLRLRAQCLDKRTARSSPSDVARALCGIQAQDLPAATQAIRPRSAGLTAADADRARNEDRSVIRTWGMRGTLHLFAAEDIGWVLALHGPVFAAASRRRRAELGLDDDLSARGVRGVRDLLAIHGPLLRAQLRDYLAARGIPTEGQATIHIIGYAALHGVLCYGPDQGGERSFVLLHDWVDRGPGLSQQASLSELARRYLAAYGPAGFEDFAAWSELPARDLRLGWQAIAGEVVEVVVAGRPAWLLRSTSPWLDELPAMALVPTFVSQRNDV